MLSLFFNKKIKKKNLYLNYGPGHPSTHGVLRLLVDLKGEYVLNVDPQIGLLHRATEKLAETKNFLQIIPYMARLDYVSMLNNEHCLNLTIEKSLNLVVPQKICFIRIIFDEITRIANHLLGLTTGAIDLGAISPFLLTGCELRELIMGFYEKTSGARLHAFFFRPGGLAYNLPLSFLNELFVFLKVLNQQLLLLQELLTYNKIWKQRLKNIGIFNKKKAFLYGFSGIMLRSSGLPFDLRKTQPYSCYNKLNFNVPISKISDSYNRYLLRIAEIKQSLFILNQILNFFSKPSFFNLNKKINVSHVFKKKKMEFLINHFLYFAKNLIIKPNFNFVEIENPKGSFGTFLVTDSSNKPYRLKIKAPGFLHISALSFLLKKHFLADIVVIIATIDLVLGEVDR